MAINPTALPEYSGQIGAPTAEYPYGEAIDDSGVETFDGTPRVAAEVNDAFGFHQALLGRAGIVPTGTPEKVGASQYMDSLDVVYVGNVLAPIVTTVGVGGEYDTLKEALVELSRLRVAYDGTNAPLGQITLKTGFIMNEQILLNGVNLGWVTILAEDAVTTVNPLSITAWLVPEQNGDLSENLRPVFGGVDNAVLPVIGFQMDYGTNNHGKDGVAVLNGSSVQFLPESGIQNCHRGLSVINQSRALCLIPGMSVGAPEAVDGVDFSGCLDRGLSVDANSSVSLARARFNNCTGDACVYVANTSSAYLFQSFMGNNPGKIGIIVRHRASISAEHCDFQGCRRGLEATLGATFNVGESFLPRIPGYGDEGAKNSTEWCLYVDFDSHGNADRLPLEGSIAAAFVNAKSSLFMNNVTLTNSPGTLLVSINDGSYANLDTTDFSNGAGTAITASCASVVCSSGIVLNDYTQIAVIASTGAVISLRTTNSTGTVGVIVLYANGGTIVGPNLVIAGDVKCARGELNIANGSSVDNVICETGGIVKLGNSSYNTLSQTKNTVTSSGIIFAN